MMNDFVKRSRSFTQEVPLRISQRPVDIISIASNTGHPPMAMSGDLRRQTAWSSWKKLFYLLKGPMLVEYRNRKSAASNSTRPLKMYPLEELRLVPAGSLCGRAFSFALLSLQPSREPHFFEAEDAGTLRTWMAALAPHCAPERLASDMTGLAEACVMAGWDGAVVGATQSFLHMYGYEGQTQLVRAAPGGMTGLLEGGWEAALKAWTSGDAAGNSVTVRVRSAGDQWVPSEVTFSEVQSAMGEQLAYVVRFRAATTTLASSPSTALVSLSSSKSLKITEPAPLTKRNSMTAVTEGDPSVMFKKVAGEVEGMVFQALSDGLREKWLEMAAENERLKKENERLAPLADSLGVSASQEYSSAGVGIRKSATHPARIMQTAPNPKSAEAQHIYFQLDLNAIEIGSKIYDSGTGPSIHLASICGWQCLVKELQRTSFASDACTRFEFELATLESLPNHENLARYLFHHTTPTHFQIFISRYDTTLGHVMTERIKCRQPFSAREIAKCLTDITSGLECLHRNDILHRDLKPDNIFASYDRNHCVSRYVVGDFDSAKNVRDRGEARTFVGTLSHMAPEIFSHDRYGKPCDIWSISVILYEMLTFERRPPQSVPFASMFGSSPSKLVIDRSQYSPVFHGLIDIFERTHIVDPLLRPTAPALLKMLFQCLVEQGAFPISNVQPSSQPKIPNLLSTSQPSSPQHLASSSSSHPSTPIPTSTSSTLPSLMDVFSPDPNWVVERQLGAGGGGAVYQVYNAQTDARAAMKMVTSSTEDHKWTEDEMKLQSDNIKREAEILKRLDHPNIVHVNELIEANGKCYLLMELVSGGELLDRLFSYPDERIPEPQARIWFRQIVAAVQYCHEHGVAHRDLKLENILLDAEDHIRVSDFGFANVFPTSDSFLKTLCGSARYAPPELLAGAMYKGPPLDIWALGIILFVMLSGDFPWKMQDDGYNLMSEVTSGRYQLPSFVSQQAGALIRSILILDPDQRPTASQLLDHPWFQQ